MNLPHYLDYAATTPLDPRVAERMAVFLSNPAYYGNPSSTHLLGLTAKNAIEDARQQVADLIHANSSEIIFTSGATEANNLALKGAAHLYKSRGKHIITLKTEHASVLDCCQFLEKEGFSVTYLAPQKNGLIHLDELKAAIRSDTFLISIMHVNNEIGIIQEIETIANFTSQNNILSHVDATQSVGKIPLDVTKCPIDLISFSAHKIYGPKGIGALFIRRKPRIKVGTQIHGGGQEQGMRAGTLPTHQIIGFGEACSIAKNEMQVNQKKIERLRDLFLSRTGDMKEIVLNSDPNHCVPHIINFRINGMKAGDVMQQLPSFALSAGSACLTKNAAGSYVLRALGQSEQEAASGIRLSLGKFVTEEQIMELVGALRKISQ